VFQLLVADERQTGEQGVSRGGSGRGGKRRGKKFDGEGTGGVLRRRRGEAGEGLVRGAT
jgi:hypothetical protein